MTAQILKSIQNKAGVMGLSATSAFVPDEIKEARNSIALYSRITSALANLTKKDTQITTFHYELRELVNGFIREGKFTFRGTTHNLYALWSKVVGASQQTTALEEILRDFSKIIKSESQN